MRIITVNVNGLRAAVRKGFLDWVAQADADVICLQEIRIQDHQLTKAMRTPGGMDAVYLPAEKPGYSGVGLYFKQRPQQIVEGIGDPDFDSEGRVLTADYGNLRVVSLYLPSGTSGDPRQDFKYKFMDAFLQWMEQQREQAEHVIVCGDWNIAHRKIDLKNWRGNQKNSGFLPEERAWMDQVLGDSGWADAYRGLHPEAEGECYTWWSNRGQAWANNTGWRIDYQICTPTTASTATSAWVYKDERFSDHSPLIVDYDLNLIG